MCVFVPRKPLPRIWKSSGIFGTPVELFVMQELRKLLGMENNVAITAFKKTESIWNSNDSGLLSLRPSCIQGTFSNLPQPVLFFLPNFYLQNFQVSTEVVHT